VEEVRHQFREGLAALERQALDGLDLVIQQLDGALESISYQDVELSGMVVADDDRIDGRYLEVHQGILSLRPVRRRWRATCGSSPRCCT
jgi:phosphate transport system protein